MGQRPGAARPDVSFTPNGANCYKHTLREADRLGLEMSLNIQSGWNLGGPMVTADDAAKKLVWSETRVTGPTNFNAALPAPEEPRKLLPRHVRRRLSPPAEPGAASAAAKLAREGAAQNARTVFHAGHHSPLFQEIPATPGEEDTRAADVVDLTSQLDANGVLKWDAPAGNWQILRFGCTIGDHSYVSTCSEGWKTVIAH